MEPREQLVLPLKLAHGACAVTRDISAAGLFFVIQGQHALSGPVDFEMQLPEISLRFTSSGEIVRVEHQDGTTGVAVRFVNPHLDVLTEGKQCQAGERTGTAHAPSTDRLIPDAADNPQGSAE